MQLPQNEWDKKKEKEKGGQHPLKFFFKYQDSEDVHVGV